VGRYQKGKTNLDLLKQETVSGIIKGGESIGFIEHRYIELPTISSKQRHPRRHNHCLYRMSGVIGSRLPGQLMKCDTCHHYQVVNTRLAADGVTSRRLPLPSTRCCHCCIYLRVLGKTLSKQLHQQPVDFPFSE